MAIPSWKDTKPWGGAPIGSWKDPEPYDPSKYKRTKITPKVITPIAPQINIPKNVDTNPWSIGKLWSGVKQVTAHPFDSISSLLKGKGLVDESASMKFQVSDEVLNKMFPGRNIPAEPILPGPRRDPNQGITGMYNAQKGAGKRYLTTEPKDVTDYQAKLQREKDNSIYKELDFLDRTVGKAPEYILKGGGAAVGAGIGSAQAVTSGIITYFGSRAAKQDWKTTYKEVVKNAKEGFEFGFEMGKAGGEVALQLPIIASMFAYSIGKGAYDVGAEIGAVYEEAKMAGDKSPATAALLAGLEKNGEEGWKIWGASEEEIKAFKDNPYLTGFGMSLYWGSVAMVAMGGTSAVKKAKFKISEINKQLTKNFDESFTIPEKISISAEKIQSIFNPTERKPLTKAEYDIVVRLSGEGKNAKTTQAFYAKAIKEGLNIEIPVERIITMVDKPYWGKLKDLIGKERTNVEISRTKLKPTQEVQTPPLQIGGATGQPLGITKPPVDPFAKLGGQKIETPVPAPVSIQKPTEIKATVKELDKISEKIVKPKKIITDKYVTPKKLTSNQVYEKGGQFIVGKYNGKPYTTDKYIMEFNSDVEAPKRATLITGKEVPSSEAIDKIIPKKTTPAEVTKVWEGGFKELQYIQLGDKTKGEVIQKKYYDYFSKKYPDAVFNIADTKYTAVVVTQNGKEVGLIMPTKDVEFNKDSNIIWEPTQKEKVASTIKKEPKTIKKITEETEILEPNVRRILGVGAKEGTFSRVDKGVYILSKAGKDIAWVETGNALESLPRLAGEGFKADMVFLDIPYDTPAIKGGNRGMNYNLITPNEFGDVLNSIKTIARDVDTPVIHMYSQAESGMAAMQKYNDQFIEKGFKPVGKGELQKTFKSGKPVTNVRGVVSKPEGILVFTQSGKLQKELTDLNFELVRPKGYQSEKPAEMLKAMIEMTTKEGDVVLDPFAGSGVTVAEAIRSGRKGYAIEKDVKVAEKITKPRVEEALEEKRYSLEELRAMTREQLVKVTNDNGILTKSGSNKQDIILQIMLQKEKPIKPSSQPSGGLGSTGDFAKIDPDKVDLKRIKTPELYRFVKSINKDFPFIMKNMRKFAGVFRGGDIAFRRSYFARKKGETEIEYQDRIAKLFAHEIGHFVDYLPDGTTKRGNLIGRLKVLSEFKKNFIDDEANLNERKSLMAKINKNNNDPVLLDTQIAKINEPLLARLKEINDGMEFNDPRFRKELLDITHTISPWEEGLNEGYDSYRRSAVELYAEFISALFTEPTLAETKAPTFFKEFFKSLDKKPVVQEALIGIQAEINGDRESLMRTRWDALKESGINAQAKYMTMIDEAQNKAKQPWLQTLKRDALYQHYWTKDVSAKAEYTIEQMDRGYNNSLYIWANEKLQPIFRKMEKSDINSNDIDPALKLERIANDETRADVANTQGFDKMTAKEVLTELEKFLGKEKADAIFKAANDFRKSLQEVQEKFPDLYTKEQKALNSSNEFYAPFNVLYNESNNIGYYIQKSKGNIDKDFSTVENLLLRTKSVINFGEKNVLKKNLIDEFTNEGKTELQKAKKIVWRDNKGQLHMEFKKAPQGMGLVEIKRSGELEGYYLPEDIANSLNQDNITELGIGFKILRGVNKPFKKLYTELNPGFQIVNFFIRDWGIASMFFQPTWIRAQKGLSNRGAMNIIANNTYRVFISKLIQTKYYWKALSNLKEKNIFKEYTPIVKEGLENHIIEISGSGMYKIDPDSFKKSDEAAVRYILQSMGLMKENSILRDVKSLIEGTGQTLEETPKLAMYMYLKDQKIITTETSQKYTSIIRNYVGSPNFWKQAKANRQISSGLLFYNPIIRGIGNLGKKAFIKDVAGKGSRSAFWYRMIRKAIIPALVGVAAEEGLLGEDIQRMYNKLSSYLKQNYLNIPIKLNDDGTVTSISIPMDEDARVVYALTQLITKLAIHNGDPKIAKQSMGDLLSYTGGQIPSAVPALKISAAWNNVLSGGNYYDKFYQRNVLTDTEEKLPMSERAKILFKWTINQNGIIKINIHDNASNQTLSSKVIRSTPIINRFIRRTDSGTTEINRNIVKEVEKEQAQESLAKSKSLGDMANRINAGEEFDINGSIRDLAISRLNDSEKDDNEKINEEVKLLVRSLADTYTKKYGDANMRSLLYASSNEAKAAIIIDIIKKKRLPAEDIKKLIEKASQAKIISIEVVILIAAAVNE